MRGFFSGKSSSEAEDKAQEMFPTAEVNCTGQAPNGRYIVEVTHEDTKPQSDSKDTRK